MHAEVVVVPVNLCVKLGDATPLKEAAFTTVGAIALQGVRQADLKLGESCAVIGLGLVGQITLQLLQASGVKVFGIDIDSKQVALAAENGADFSFHRDEPQLESVLMQHTGGFGADAVIITAATSSTDPVDLAGILCRRKAKVIIVGAVPTGFSRKNYYIKELELKMSCSYGPGRYDADYEERGIDYPYEYVRWTENRNMEAFVSLLENKKIDLSKLITHAFPFQEAPKAYDLILNKAEAFSGIVLEYDTKKKILDRVNLKDKPTATDSISVGMIGAGSFGQNFLLPACFARKSNINGHCDRPRQQCKKCCG
ncbi:MAG: zinc-binding alcohol dehydrogenase [Bacteroidetes bacterium]|nr:zinc-binding alcohol dehydrogenase [Bacteroidota bacterium]